MAYFFSHPVCYIAYFMTVIFCLVTCNSTRASHVCNVIVISVFKALQKHQLHDNYIYSFVIFAYTRPPYWTELNLLMSSVHFGRKPKRRRVYVSLNRTSQNHYVSEPNRTGAGQNHALNKLVIFRFEIPIDNWKNCKKILGDTFLPIPVCRTFSTSWYTG